MWRESRLALATAIKSCSTLYQAPQIGDISGIEKEVTRLRQLAPPYVAFTNKLLQLAQEFEEQEILKLVEQSIPKS